MGICGDTRLADSTEDYWFNRFCDLVVCLEANGHLSRESDFYEHLAEMLLRMTHGEYVSLSMLMSDRKDFVLVAHSGRLSSQQVSAFSSVPADVGRYPVIVSSKTPVFMDFAHPHAGDIIRVEESYEFPFAVTAPIVFNGEVLGTYNVCYLERPLWTEREIGYFQLVGRLLGALIHREDVRRKLFELQTLEESRRMSVEVHDNIAQAISAALLEADKACMSFDAGEFDLLAGDLRSVEKACHTAADLVRSELLGLREVADLEESLLVDVGRTVDRFRSQWNVGAILEPHGINEQTVVSGSVQIQILRILHEALSNVIRHSKADSVVVRLECEGNQIILSICDNGCGFDVDGVPFDHLGLRIMAERAKAVGGSLDVESERGKGTVVHAAMPRFY